MLFSFVKRRFWWPKYSYVLSKRFSSVLLEKNRGLKIFFTFRNKRRFLGVLKPSFLSVYSKSCLYSILKKNSQKRSFSFNFFKIKIKTLKEDRKKLNRIAKIWVRFSTNNIFFNITDSKNKLLTYFSSGLIGFCGPTKTSSFALDQILDKVIFFFKKKNLKHTQLIFLSGMFNYKSKSVVESIINKGLSIRSVTYRINTPHNGLRRRKAKRR
jgi:small subunit ribosomal protein S11